MTEEPNAGQPPQGKTPPRQFKRYSCRLPVRMRRVRTPGLFAGDDRYIEGRVLNQSKGGLLIESPIWIPEDAQLEVSFKSPSAKQTFFGAVTVRWVSRRDGFFLLGVAARDLREI